MTLALTLNTASARKMEAARPTLKQMSVSTGRAREQASTRGVMQVSPRDPF